MTEEKDEKPLNPFDILEANFQKIENKRHSRNDTPVIVDFLKGENPFSIKSESIGSVGDSITVLTKGKKDE